MAKCVGGILLVLFLWSVLAPLLVDAARVTSVTLCRSVAEPDLVPIDIQEVFATTVPEIHAIVELTDVTQAVRIGGAWIAIDAIATPNYEIDAMELEVGTGQGTRAHISLTKPNNDWPPGNYKLEVSIDGKLATVKTFEIVAAAGPGATGNPQATSGHGSQTAPPATETVTTSTGHGYSGTYVIDAQGTRVTLALDEDAQGVLTGSLSSTSGMQFQLEGQAEEGAAVGLCYDQNGAVYFEAYADGNDLWFSLIEMDANNMPDYERAQELMFTKVGSNSAPAAGRQPPTQSTPGGATGQGQSTASGAGAAGFGAAGGNLSGSPTTAADGAVPGSSHNGRSGKLFKHPVGFSFWYPDSWQAIEQEEFLQLVPPDPGSTPEGPTEIYGVTGESVAGEGISSPEDPRVVQYMDEQIRSISPYVKRTGSVSTINMSQGQGAVINWEGQSPRGDQVHARAFVSIIRQHGVALIGIGFADRLAARDADLRQMFSSFGFGEGQRDPAITGSWQLVSTQAITNQSPFESAWSRAQAVSETSSVLVFRPDGTWIRTDKSHTLVGAGGVWLEDKDSSSSEGSWNAGEGLLYMVWQDGSYRECKYQVEYAGSGRQLRLVCGDTGEIWQPSE